LTRAAVPALAEEPVTHVHVGDHELKSIMDHGMSGSPTLRQIVAALDAAPIQIFVGCDALMPRSLSGRLNLVSTVGGVRYVRIAIRCSLSSQRQLSYIAHELQHALEIADNSAIADLDSMESYYADYGFSTHMSPSTRTFETDAAIEIQRRVDEEMEEADKKGHR
jgi:hypothetical protein